MPGKNTALVGGKPCIEWTVDAACNAETIGSTIVSTDCPVVQDLACADRVSVIRRPPELATDTATIDSAARHALHAFEARAASQPLHPRTPIVILYANVPIRPDGLLDNAVRLLRSSGAESVQSYAPVGKHHPWWTCVVEQADGSVRPFDGEPGDSLFHDTYRRQSLPPAHIPDGGVMVVTRRALMLELPAAPSGPHAFLGPACSRRGIINPEGAVIDIDSPMDLLVADIVMQQRSGGTFRSRQANDVSAGSGEWCETSRPLRPATTT